VVGDVMGKTLDISACGTVRHVLQKRADVANPLVSTARNIFAVVVPLTGVNAHNGRDEGCSPVRKYQAFRRTMAIDPEGSGSIHRERQRMKYGKESREVQGMHGKPVPPVGCLPGSVYAKGEWLGSVGMSTQLVKGQGGH
jgi:hypothetical protein